MDNVGSRYDLLEVAGQWCPRVITFHEHEVGKGVLGRKLTRPPDYADAPREQPGLETTDLIHFLAQRAFLEQIVWRSHSHRKNHYMALKALRVAISTHTLREKPAPRARGDI